MIAVDLVTDISSPSGYSAHARDVIKAFGLIQDEVDLRIIDHKHDSVTIDLPQNTVEYYRSLIAKTRAPDVVVHFETPEFYLPNPNVPSIGFTVWETTAIPSTDLNDNPKFNWVKQMNLMSRIWTGCSSSALAFQNSGVIVPVDVLHGPVDTDFYRPGLAELDITDVVYQNDTFMPRESRPLVLGCIAQWTPRKNLTDLLICVLSYFKRGEIILVLKTYGSNMGPEQTNAVLKQIQGIRAMVKNPDAPAVVVLTQKMTDEEIARLYSSLDVVVSVSRGEGLCLPLVQGMAAGCVPMSVAFSAPMDYLDAENGYLVDYTLEPAVHMPTSPWYRYNQEWARVDVANLKYWIQVARDQKTTGRLGAKGKIARDRIIQKMSPRVFAASALASLKEVVNGCTV